MVSLALGLLMGGLLAYHVADFSREYGVRAALAATRRMRALWLLALIADIGCSGWLIYLGVTGNG